MLLPPSKTVLASPVIRILYENDAWLGPWTGAIERRGVNYALTDLDSAAFAPDRGADCPLVINRISPSAYIRGHGAAIELARALLATWEGHGTRVINGGHAFDLETSKVRQMLLLQELGLDTPHTLILNRPEAARDVPADFPFPAILKPDTGGSGALVRRVGSAGDLEDALRELEARGEGRLMLLQEELPVRERGVLRMEFVDGELLYAMQVHPRNTFNLCPADACERAPAVGVDSNEEPGVDFEWLPDIDPVAVAQGREVVRRAGLDVGGVEFVETGRGRRCFFDLNATSVYRTNVCETAGVDAYDKLGAFLEREMHKEAQRLRRSA